jgi:hypothetical protein
MKDGNMQNMVETQEEGKREKMTKGNEEQTGNSIKSSGKHHEQDGRGSEKAEEGAKVKRFTRLCGLGKLF